MKNLFMFALTLTLLCCTVWPASGQEQPAQQPSAEEIEKQKAELEKNAYRLLDQVIDEAQALRLVENRVRIQINAADMLWEQNQVRSRSLFANAADGISELNRTQPPPTNGRRNVFTQGGSFVTFQVPPAQQNFRLAQLRQELVLTAAKHDASLAYQLLATTKPPVTAQPQTSGRRPAAQFSTEENLEQMLLGRIAAIDPKFAAQNAEQMMEKGQFPQSLTQVISQLYRQDAEAADKLGDKTVKQLQSSNILTKTDASALAQSLVRLGPRQAGTDSAGKTKGSQGLLTQSNYVDLLSTVVDAALKANPSAQTNQRGGPGNQRGRIDRAQITQSQSDSQIEQASARRMLSGLQVVMEMIDQYLPSKATMVKQKLTEMGMSNNATTNLSQTLNAMRGDSTSDALVEIAASAPQQLQSRLYQQAAYKALDEGDTDRARQIANDHLQNNARDAVMQRIDFREIAKKAEGGRLEDVRQSVAKLQTDNEKIDLLIQVANEAQQANPKLALQLLEDARQIVNHRASNYDEFSQQLRVAHAYASLDAARSFEIMDPGISQLNELLSAASILSGFEINMFRDGEMAMQVGNGLSATISRYGQELAVLAKTDFERSETLAGRFQFAEPRIMTRLAIVQGVLGVKPNPASQRTFIGSFTESFVSRPN